MHIGRSRSSKVIDFDTNRKHVLARHSNLGPILHHLWYNYRLIAQVKTQPLFHQANFGGVPVRPDLPCWGQPEPKP